MSIMTADLLSTLAVVGVVVVLMAGIPAVIVGAYHVALKVAHIE
jgi:ABC-type phosphate transport system permease subunit